MPFKCLPIFVVPTHVGEPEAIDRETMYQNVVPTHVGVNRTSTMVEFLSARVVPTHVGVNRRIRQHDQRRHVGVNRLR